MEYMESWERRIRGKSCCTSAEVVYILFSVFQICFLPHIALITTKKKLSSVTLLRFFLSDHNVFLYQFTHIVTSGAHFDFSIYTFIAFFCIFNLLVCGYRIVFCTLSQVSLSYLLGMRKNFLLKVSALFTQRILLFTLLDSQLTKKTTQRGKNS